MHSAFCISFEVRIMDKLLTFLKSIPEYQLLLKSIGRDEAAAVTGMGQINRSHLIAGLRQEFDRPIVVICQDDMTAKRLQQELAAFLAAFSRSRKLKPEGLQKKLIFGDAF